MFQPFTLFAGLRYTRSRRRERFVSFVTVFSLSGMVLGVAALVIVMAVMNGFDRELKDRILEFLPHAFVDAADGRMTDWHEVRALALKVPGVEGAAPYLESDVLLTYMGRTSGAHLTAIDPSQYKNVSTLDRHVVAGSFEAMRPGDFSIVLGSIIASQLGVRVGDKVTVAIPKVVVTPAGVFPRQKRFTVAGIFQAGAQIDATEAFIRLADGYRLFATTAPKGLQIAATNIFRAGAVAAELRRQLPNQYRVRDWSETQGDLFRAVKMEKTMVALLLFIIVFVAAFNIVAILTLMVADKRADIAVLRTMGASARQIMRIFIIQGSAVGLAGAAIGAAIGIPVAYYVGDIVAFFEHLFGFQVFNPQVYFITRIPSDLHALDIAWTLGGALLLSFGATLYPSYRASRIQPAEVLRYE